MIKVYWLYANDGDKIFTDGYVGISKNTKTRIYQHKKRFGEFKHKVIFYGSLQQCLALEFQLRPVPGIGWNRACGGFEGYRLGHSEETKNVLKDKRAKQIAPMTGLKQSEETKLKIRNSNLGKIRSDETRARLKAAKQNISEETRAKTAAASRGRKLSTEAKAKVSEALRNRVRNPETIEKIRLSVKASWDKRHGDLTCVTPINALADIDLATEKVNG